MGGGPSTHAAFAVERAMKSHSKKSRLAVVVTGRAGEPIVHPLRGKIENLRFFQLDDCIFVCKEQRPLDQSRRLKLGRAVVLDGDVSVELVRVSCD